MGCSIIAFTFCLENLSNDLLVGISFALLLYGVLQLPATCNPQFAILSKKFAGFSYSLYVLHFPMLFLIRAIVNSRVSWQPDGRHLIYGFGIAVFLLCYAFLVSRISEANTGKIRRWIRTHSLQSTAERSTQPLSAL